MHAPQAMYDTVADFSHLFLNDVPMLDVRAPVEFGQGAFPGAVNRPLMNDGERQQIGTCYKQQGQEAAIAMGHQLVSGPTRSERIASWAAFAQAHPQGVLYCFRGGLRSQIVQQWLRSDAQTDYPRVKGGYKALRSFLINTTDDAAQQCDLVVLSGLTGTGKTELITQLAHGLDLEGHANHRGSSFGQRVSAQPGQIDFENRLAIDILKKRAQGHQAFVLEDEGRHVGKCAVPLALRQRLEQAPIVCLRDSVEHRIERILRDYVVQQRADFVAAQGPALGAERFGARLLESLDKLERRLGGDRHRKLRALMQTALARQEACGEVDLHCAWITALVRDYYDPMYAFQRDNRRERIAFEGDERAVLDYLRARSGAAAQAR
jgi:tRNA 2-selenouridine synthase